MHGRKGRALHGPYPPPTFQGGAPTFVLAISVPLLGGVRGGFHVSLTQRLEAGLQRWLATLCRPESRQTICRIRKIQKRHSMEARRYGGCSQDAQANLPGATFLTSFTPLAVVWNQTLMLP